MSRSLHRFDDANGAEARVSAPSPTRQSHLAASERTAWANPALQTLYHAITCVNRDASPESPSIGPRRSV